MPRPLNTVDPARIDEFVEALRAAWKAHPAWSFGQIVTNAMRVSGCDELRRLHDFVLLERLHSWLARKAP